MGGDDFITKPIEDCHLVTSIKIRVERARVLSKLVSRDSLTGLFNHSVVKERLVGEISRAMRLQKPVAFAMIDLDNFKNINDSYGHLVGDRVIKSLSRLLMQRLRRRNVIGRYGGEEFAVILGDMTPHDAIDTIEEIRKRREQLRFIHDGNEFSVTFSAGIASYPECDSAEALNQAADDALYKAKKEGRNRIVVQA